jgi:hypothetical protein
LLPEQQLPVSAPPASVHTTNLVQKAAISWDGEEVVHQDSQQNTHSANSDGECKTLVSAE